jgi:hypothetical protein
MFYADVAEPQSLNKYHYCLNNPLRYIDPDGHQTTVADRLKDAAVTTGDFLVGVGRGISSSMSFGYFGGPKSTDSLANRAGQGTGTAIVEVVGAASTNAGGGLIALTDGVAATSPAVDAVTVGGVVMQVGAGRNAIAIATTPIQRKRKLGSGLRFLRFLGILTNWILPKTPP